MPFIPKIRDFDSRVALCSMRDVVEKNGDMELTREAVLYCWACIRSYKNVTPFMSVDGYTIMAPSPVQLQTTHVVYIRAPIAVDFTSAAWIYEKRRKSPPRWYKVLGFTEDSRWTTVPVRLLEKSDMAQPPQGMLQAQPQRVEL